MTREQVLDELDLLATVEHALVVEHLSVSCALGHDLDAADGGATSQQGRDAAGAAAGLAQDAMFHLQGLNRILLDAGRSGQLARAGSIRIASGADVELGTPTAAQLAALLDREDAIAAAVDARYERLRTGVAAFDGDLLDQLRAAVEGGTSHAAAVAGLRDTLGGVPPADFLRATRRDAADAFEQRLLDVSDRSYGLVVAALREQFGQPDFLLAGAFRGIAVSAMEGLDDVHRLLVQRGLLPPFSPA